MKRTQLQELAKQNGIKANKKSQEIIKELIEIEKKVTPIENKTEIPFLPPELVRKIFTKKIKLEALDKNIKIIKMIKKAMNINNYLNSDRNINFSQYNKASNINIYYDDFFYINDINYLKIIKKLKIGYDDSEDIIQIKIEPLIIEIITILELYTFLLENVEELYSLYYENGYDENDDEETIRESKYYFDEIKNREMTWYDDKYQNSIYKKINLLNNKIKELKKFGFVVNKIYIKKINDLIDKINNDPNNIKKITVFLKIYKVSTSNTSSNSNSSTRKKSK
jgi:hypothetical protein